MKVSPYSVICAFLLLALAPFAAVHAQDEVKKPENAEKQAERAGVEWLRLLDRNDMDTAWDRTSSELHESISRDQFKEQMQLMREGLGPIITRRLDSATYRTSVPGAQEGQYVVLVFNSRFKDKGRAREVLTMSYNKDKWEPAGYFVR